MNKIKNSTIETKIKNIIDNNQPKSITIDGKECYVSKQKINEIKLLIAENKDGGFLPLLPLIIGGIAAAGSIAGGTAGIVKSVNDKKYNDEKLAEEKRHNKLIESKLGKGIFLPNYNGDGVKDDIKKFIEKTLIDDVGKKFLKKSLKYASDKIGITKSGEGLYLHPKK